MYDFIQWTYAWSILSPAAAFECPSCTHIKRGESVQPSPTVPPWALVTSCPSLDLLLRLLVARSGKLAQIAVTLVAGLVLLLFVRLVLRDGSGLASFGSAIQVARLGGSAGVKHLLAIGLHVERVVLYRGLSSLVAVRGPLAYPLVVLPLSLTNMLGLCRTRDLALGCELLGKLGVDFGDGGQVCRVHTHTDGGHFVLDTLAGLIV